MLKNQISAFFLLIITAVCANSQVISDYGAARDWCDNNMLTNIEGIWEFPEDHTCVLIKQTKTDNSLYDIVVVESPDVRLLPGETIGYLKASASSDKYEMGIYRTKLKTGVFSELGKCMAQYNSKDEALTVKGRKLKFSLTSRWLLPSFWRLIKISVNDPLDALPKGLVRLYPTSKRRYPDYL